MHEIPKIHFSIKHNYFLLVHVFSSITSCLIWIQSSFFIYRSNKFTNQEPSDFDLLLLSNLSWNCASVLISSFAIFILLVSTFYYFYIKPKHQYTEIDLEFTNGNNCTNVPSFSFWEFIKFVSNSFVFMPLTFFSGQNYITQCDYYYL